MSELKPCPFCGGSVSVIPCCYLDEYTDESSYSWAIAHNDFNNGCRCSLNLPGEYRTLECEEADAQKQRLIAAWNTRAAYEMDGWFYLPKPKQRLFDYTTDFSFDDVSLKATGTVDVYALANAVRKWQEDELNQHIIERICEVFKPERTCHRVDVNGYGFRFECSACGHVSIVHNCETRLDELPNYCPKCGAKVIEEEE